MTIPVTPFYLNAFQNFISRTTTATYFDVSGNLQTAAINTARTNDYYWNGSSWINGGTLVEPASTNSIPNNTMAGVVVSSALTPVAITSISNASYPTITVTATAHGLNASQIFAIAGSNPAGYNGTYTVTSVTTNTFSFLMGTNPGAYVSGASYTAWRVGQPPTGWALQGGGLSAWIAGTGTENGISYVDWAFRGVSRGAITAAVYSVSTGSTIAAALGQTWTTSLYCKLTTGSFGSPSAINLVIQELDSGAVGLGTHNTALLPTGSALSTQSYSGTSVLTNASTAFARPYFLITYSGSGVSVDFTVRIGMPQFEQYTQATSVIATSSGSVARDYDIFTTTPFAASPPQFKQAARWINQAAQDEQVEVDDIRYDNLRWLRNARVADWKVANAAVNVSKFVQFDVLAQPDTGVSVDKFVQFNVLAQPDTGVSVDKFVQFSILESVPPLAFPAAIKTITNRQTVWDEIEQEEYQNARHIFYRRNLTSQINAKANPIGVVGTFGVGSPTASSSTSKSVIGVVASSGIGVFAIHASSTKTLTGVASASAIGAPAAMITKLLIGVSGSGAVSTPVPTIAKLLVGVSGAGAVSTPVSTFTKLLAGVSGSGAVSTPVSTIIKLLIGVASTAAVGTPVSTVEEPLTGVASVGVIGNARLAIAVPVLHPIGVESVVEIGVFETRIPRTLVSVVSYVVPGWPSANQHWFRELSPVIATSHLGRFSENMQVFLHGVYATSQLGVLNNHFFRNLVGVRMVSHLGNLRSVVVGDGLLMRNFAVISNIESVPNTLSMKYSDTKGGSYGNFMEQSMGKPGQYFSSIKYNRLGMGRDRVFLLQWTSPNATGLTGVFIDSDGGAT